MSIVEQPDNPALPQTGQISVFGLTSKSGRAAKPALLGYCHLAVNRLWSGLHLFMMQIPQAFK